MSTMGDGKAKKTPTIYDVAEAAGVAPSTVSRAFARPGRVNAQTAQRIRDIAAQMGYRTNPLARALPTGQTRMIALVIADVTNPFHFGIIRGAETAATEAGYTMILADSQESDRLERRLLERTLPAVEGVVLASPRMSDSGIRTIAKQRPTMVLNRAVSDVPSVVTDIPRGARRVAEHLGELGHRSFVYLAGPEASWTDGTRWRSLLEASVELDMTARRLGPFSPTVSGGVKAAEALGQSPAGAVVAYNDLMAVGVMRGLQARGIRIPQQVSVVGFDDIFSSDLVTPGLTTVAAPLRSLGTTAVRNLIAIINGAESRVGEPITMPTRLVVRSSTAQRRRRRTLPALGTSMLPGTAS